MTADDLTPGTPRPARVGDTVHTASELDALPVGAIVRGRSGMLSRGDGRFGPTWYHHPSRDHAADSATVAEVEGSMTVLFRPDAPQPVTENSAPAVLASDDAVDRAARAAWEEAYDEDQRSYHPWDAPWVKQTWTDIARAALAAAGAGAEVDREALNERHALDKIGGEAGLIEECRRLAAHPDQIRQVVPHFFEMLADVLAARGDAATPTEVEWGVREEGRTTASYSREDAEDWINDEDAWNPGETRTLVQRTVSAWREVTP